MATGVVEGAARFNHEKFLLALSLNWILLPFQVRASVLCRLKCGSRFTLIGPSHKLIKMEPTIVRRITSELSIGVTVARGKGKTIFTDWRGEFFVVSLKTAS